jgi:hypothetical protein
VNRTRFRADFVFQTAQGKTHLRIPAAHFARALQVRSAQEGVGNAGRTMHPQSGRAEKQAVPVTVTTGPPKSLGIPAREWF